MTATEQPGHLTVRTFLFGDVDDRSAIGQLAESLEEQGAAKSLKDCVGGLSAAGYRAIHEQLAALANGLLNIEVGTLLVAAWCKWRRLIDAARATAADPERTELVTMQEHRILSQRRPDVDVLVDGVKVATFTFVLTLQSTVEAFVGVVRQGKLVAVDCGKTLITGTLGVEGCPRPLKQCQATIDLPLVVNLGHGVPLLRRDLHLERPLRIGVAH